MAAQPSAHPPITTHLLDTSTGRPAAGVSVSLVLLKPHGPTHPFTAVTDADGRVNTWSQMEGPTMAETIESLSRQGKEATVWALRVDTGTYYGAGKTLWPELEVRFFVTGGGETYHLGVLLGPWGYSVYRGS